MRYVISFFDRSTKRVPQEDVPQFMAAMNNSGNVLCRGQMYSGKSISSIQSIIGYYKDRVSDANESGKFFCKYGYLHPARGECSCKDAGKERMLNEEEMTALPLWNEAIDASATKSLLSSSAQR